MIYVEKVFFMVRMVRKTAVVQFNVKVFLSLKRDNPQTTLTCSLLVLRIENTFIRDQREIGTTFSSEIFVILPKRETITVFKPSKQIVIKRYSLVSRAPHVHIS